MFGRNYFGGPTFGGARPTARLAGRPKLGQQQGLACCTMPNGEGHCFDTGSGECIDLWVSASGAPPGSPACVQNSQGQYVHPSCLGLEAPAGSTDRPELPPGCTYVAAPGNPMQEVICECYNCTTRQSDGWRGMLGAFIAAGGKNPCLKDPQWFPKPAQCPSGPGGGGTYTPPAAAPTPSQAQAPTPTSSEAGEVNASDGSLLSLPIIACPIGDNLYNLYEDSGAPPYQLVSEGRNNVQANAEGHILPSTDPRCVAALGAGDPSTPTPFPVIPPTAGPYPTSPGQIRIQPSPFGGGSVVPRQIPFAPAAPRGGMPMQRATFTSCPANTPPVKVRQLRSETFQARPDNFQAPLWTNF